ncbi:MAG: hypothetical protein AAF596_01205 [Planctomycetota bacterium]
MDALPSIRTTDESATHPLLPDDTPPPAGGVTTADMVLVASVWLIVLAHLAAGTLM